MLKTLQARLQKYMNHEFPDVQAGFRKSRGTRDQIANIHWKKHRKSKRIPEKTSTSASLTILKPLTVWITTTVGNSKRVGNTRLPYLPPERPVCKSRSNN